MIKQNKKLKIAIINSVKFRNQMDFAQHIGMRNATLSSIVSGRLNPRDEEKKIIADALDTKVNNLFS